MCVMSLVADHYQEKWSGMIPWTNGIGQSWPPQITREEFDTLRRDFDDLKALLKRAKAYDEANHEPDCETAEKMEFLRKMAKMIGVDLPEAGAAQ